MSQPTFRCDDSLIECLLAGSLDRNAARNLEEHLDRCQMCQERLEELAAAPAEWAEVREQLSCWELESQSSPSDSSHPQLARHSTNILAHLAPTDDPQMLGRLGSYEVAGIIGSGGMGIVLKGWDRALNRFVAIKVLAPHLAANVLARRRFSREAQAAAAVVHDNIVAIHGVSEAGDLPYLVMPYIPGPSLQKRIDKRGPLALVEVLRIGHQIASGLAAAHAQGLVHRDIKPANILLEDGVERLRITDFGLARAIDDASLTQEGMLAGTPQYMSPEQARGETVGPQSDLFSLGSLLYAVCTGRPPFRGESSYGILRGITDHAPRPIRELNADMPGWLEAIIGKLLSKDARDRFGSAQEVAQLLQECLAHVQHPTIVPLPSRALELAQSAAGPTKRRSLASTPRIVVAALMSGVMTLTVLAWWVLATKVKPDHEGSPGVASEARVSPMAFDPIPTVLPASPGFIRALAFSADGQQLVAGSSDHAQVAKSHAGAISIWNMAGRRLQTTFPEDSGIFSVALSPDGKQVALGNGRGVVKVLDPKTGKLLLEERIGTGDTSVCYSAKGRWLAGGCQSGTLVVWSAVDLKKQTFSLEGPPASILTVGFSHDESKIAAGGGTFPPDKTFGSARVWELSTGNRLTTMRHGAPVMDLTFSADDTLLATACLDARARLWSLRSGETTHSLRDAESGLVGIRFRDDERVVTLGPKSGLKLWRLDSDREPARLRLRASQLTAMALSPDGKLIACGGHEHLVQLWDIERQDVVSELHLIDGNELSPAPIVSLAISADKSRMAIGREDGGIVIRETRSGRLLQTMAGDNRGSAASTNRALGSKPVSTVELHGGHRGAVNALVFSKSGHEIISGGADGDLRVWNIASGQAQELVYAHEAGIRSLAISPDGATVVAGSADRRISVWNAGPIKEIRRWEAHDSAVNAIAFDPEGSSFFTAGEDGVAKRWKTDNGDLLITCDAHRAPIHAMAITPNGQTIATGSNDGQVVLWNARTSLDRRALPRHGSAVRCMQFSDDGSSLIVSGDGGGIRVWDVSNLSQRQALTVHTKAVTGLSLVGNNLVTVSLDGTTKIWKPLAVTHDREGTADVPD